MFNTSNSVGSLAAKAVEDLHEIAVCLEEWQADEGTAVLLYDVLEAYVEAADAL